MRGLSAFLSYLPHNLWTESGVSVQVKLRSTSPKPGRAVGAVGAISRCEKNGHLAGHAHVGTGLAR
jgi:hypothetical protein